MTQAPHAERTAVGRRRERPGTSGRHLLRSGWIPFGCLLVIAVAVLRHYDVPLRDMAVFAVFTVAGVTVPGMLLWRALHGRARFFAEEVAAGSAVGHALITLAYVPARASGHPRLAVVPALVTIGAFAVVPRLRRHWRGRGYADRIPVVHAWAVTAIVGYFMVSTGTAFFRVQGLIPPKYRFPLADMQFHLGLVGELKHHMPPQSPQVLGEPLHYHWFVYADMAATSWATGLEPQTLLYRLFTPGVLATSLVLFVALARHITGRWWAAPAVLALTYFAQGPSIYAWAPALGADLMLRDDIAMFSPTHGFGTMLFAAAMLLVIRLLDGESEGAGRWILLALLFGAVMGAKATFLPMLVCGLVLVIVVTRIVHGRIPRAAIAMIALALPFVFFAEYVIFGGSSGGMEVVPGVIFAVIAVTAAHTQDVSLGMVRIVAVVTMFGRACLWSPILGLLARPRRTLSTSVLLLLGIGAAGLAVGTLVRFPGTSQLFFIYAAVPYLSLAAVSGLIAILPGRLTWLSATALLGALAGGVGAVLLTREIVGGSPVQGDMTPNIVRTFMVFASAVAGCLLVIVLAGRRHARLQPIVASTFVAGLMVPATLVHTREMWRPIAASVERITPGTLEAGRWLRDHSRPDDVVATNSTCDTNPDYGCDDKHFAVAAYTERRVLVESWAFTERTHMEGARLRLPDSAVSFWDQRRLDDNYLAFHAPSKQAIGRLRQRYGVRWLFADGRDDPPAPGLDRFARLRYASGDCRVYEIVR